MIRKRAKARAALVCLVMFLGCDTMPTIAAESQTKDPLADAILARVRERLTPASASTADLEASRIRAFTQSVASLVVYKTPSDRLQAAALAAIDSASERPATASDLVRAAIVGVLDSIGHGAKLVNMRDALQLQRPITSFRDVGNIRVISPAFTPERGTFGCDGFNQYFDLSDSRVTGLILDLRGNQGGSPQMAVCIADFFVGPGVPIFTIQTNHGRDRLDSQATSRRLPSSLPVAIFIDKETNSGALGFAAALQDQQRALIVGEQTRQIEDYVLNLMPTPKGQDTYMLPVGELLHSDGRALAVTGVRIDIAAQPSDDDAMLRAARKAFDDRKR